MLMQKTPLQLPLFRGFSVDSLTNLEGTGRVDRGSSELYVLDDALVVDHERPPVAETAGLVVEAVKLRDIPPPVAEQREFDPDILGEASVRWGAVHAYSQDLCFGFFEFGDISLIRLEFLRSATCEGKHEEGQHDILLTLELAEFDLIALRVRQGEIGRPITDLETRLRSRRDLGEDTDGSHQ
jgi:hypothetical protein